MKKLQNTLYILTPDKRLSLAGETVVIKQGSTVLHSIPLHNLESILIFGGSATTELMGKCAADGIHMTFLNRNGKFLARVQGTVNGNVLLRRQQYRIADDEQGSLKIAKNMILGKLFNSRWTLERTIRDHGLRIDTDQFKAKSNDLKGNMEKLAQIQSVESLRGLEGESAVLYFSVFDDMILQQKEHFQFKSRNKRPPQDNVNALLSFAYSLMTVMCSSALESVGLDPYVGFLHTDRPGRASLALDLVEEFRASFCDRFVLTLINKRIITDSDFTHGKRRLRKVAKECVNYGIRVQNSVFECTVDGVNFRILKEKLIRIIDKEKDSLRFYNLGNNHKTKIEHYGIEIGLDLEKPLIF